MSDFRRSLMGINKNKLSGPLEYLEYIEILDSFGAGLYYANVFDTEPALLRVEFFQPLFGNNTHWLTVADTGNMRIETVYENGSSKKLFGSRWKDGKRYVEHQAVTIENRYLTVTTQLSQRQGYGTMYSSSTTAIPSGANSRLQSNYNDTAGRYPAGTFRAFAGTHALQGFKMFRIITYNTKSNITHDFIPARVKDVYGLYDSSSNIFYPLNYGNCYGPAATSDGQPITVNTYNIATEQLEYA